MAIYSDRHSVFTSNVDEARRKSKPQPTQFQKICDHLGIELILAHSPEAKGRVERLFQTLQKRWPKEFRILGIHNLAEANERMPELEFPPKCCYYTFERIFIGSSLGGLMPRSL